MFIWADMHGMATITRSNVMAHLGLARQVEASVTSHIYEMIDAAMGTQDPAEF